MPVPTLPDALAVARQAVVAQSAVSAAVGGRVYGSRIPSNPVWPLIVVTVVDETEREWYALVARVQVDVWAAGSAPSDEQAARQIASLVWASCRDMIGTYTAGRVTSAAPLTSVPGPDPDTGRHRLILDVQLELSP